MSDEVPYAAQLGIRSFKKVPRISSPYQSATHRLTTVVIRLDPPEAYKIRSMRKAGKVHEIELSVNYQVGRAALGS